MVPAFLLGSMGPGSCGIPVTAALLRKKHGRNMGQNPSLLEKINVDTDYMDLWWTLRSWQPWIFQKLGQSQMQHYIQSISSFDTWPNQKKLFTTQWRCWRQLQRHLRSVVFQATRCHWAVSAVACEGKKLWEASRIRGWKTFAVMWIYYKNQSCRNNRTTFQFCWSVY